jgi:hypothetical protein
MAQLFGVEIPAISKHLSNIFETGELQQNATISIMETVQQEGTRNVKRTIEFYNLDAIIAVGYRVNSKQATQFRIWATQTLKEYILKGFVLNISKHSFTIKKREISLGNFTFQKICFQLINV